MNDALLPIILGHSWEAVVSPMWLLGMSAVPLYPVLIARLLVQDGMWKQIAQSFVSKSTWQTVYIWFSRYTVIVNVNVYWFVNMRRQCEVSLIRCFPKANGGECILHHGSWYHVPAGCGTFTGKPLSPDHFHAGEDWDSANVQRCHYVRVFLCKCHKQYHIGPSVLKNYWH